MDPPLFRNRDLPVCQSLPGFGKLCREGWASESIDAVASGNRDRLRQHRKLLQRPEDRTGRTPEEGRAPQEETASHLRHPLKSRRPVKDEVTTHQGQALEAGLRREAKVPTHHQEPTDSSPIQEQGPRGAQKDGSLPHVRTPLD
jgi:hypothetical protein